MYSHNNFRSQYRHDERKGQGQVSSSILKEIEQACLALIKCKRQRGDLRISKRACALRYMLAQEKDRRFSEDEFGMAQKAGLEICRECSEGRIYAENEILYQHGGSHNSSS